MTLTPQQVQRVRFDPPQAGHNGYSEHEVDAFLDLVEATLRGEARLTPADVRDVVFSPSARFRRGYDAAQVDAFLDEVQRELARRAEAAAEAWPVGGSDLRAVRLPRATPPERSYAASDVDALLERAAAALDGGGGLSAGQLAAIRLTPGSAVPGYLADAVDELLAAVQRELQRRDG